MTKLTLASALALALSSCVIPRAQAEDAPLFGFRPVQYVDRDRGPSLLCVRRACHGWGWVFNRYVCYCVYRPDLYARGAR